MRWTVWTRGWTSYKQTQTRDVGIIISSTAETCLSSSLQPPPVYSLVSDQLFAEGATILPLPATQSLNARHTNPQNSRTRIKLNRVHDDTMSSPASSSRISGLGPRHRRPPTVESHVSSDDSDEEHERHTTNFNHPVSASTCRFSTL